jgi:uncharacterized protein YodC (DUF2158 family)
MQESAQEVMLHRMREAGVGLPLFRKGDIVRLRGGGPPMTVEDPNDGAIQVPVGVAWFDGFVVRRDAFFPETLALKEAA